MAEVIRTFVAVTIPLLPRLRGVLSKLDKMGRPVRAVAGQSMHVTLKFLGETDPELAADIGGIVQITTEQHSAIDLRIVGLGVFPHSRRPAVVWAGLQDAEPLVELAGALQERLEPLGFPRENRAFQPHLTLARVRARPPKELAELLKKHETTEFGAVSVKQVILYQSELSGEGPRYSILSSANLPGPKT